MKQIDVVAAVLIVVGAINWGLIAAARFDLVAACSGRSSVRSRRPAHFSKGWSVWPGCIKQCHGRRVQSRWAAAPSPSTSSAEWLDFNGPDRPYRLNGWVYWGRYGPGSRPPQRRCIDDGEWYIVAPVGT